MLQIISFGSGFYGADNYGVASDNTDGVGMSTFGKTTIGAQTFSIAANFQQASKYTLSENGTVTGLSMYLDGITTGTQVIRLVVWDATGSGGLPGALKITSNEKTLDANTLNPGWVDFTLPANVALTAADYWIGFIAGSTTTSISGYSDNVAAARQFVGRAYTSGPSDPFGTPGGNAADQISIYATYTPDAVSPGSTSSSQSNLVASQARRPHAATARSHRR